MCQRKRVICNVWRVSSGRHKSVAATHICMPNDYETKEKRGLTSGLRNFYWPTMSPCGVFEKEVSVCAGDLNWLDSSQVGFGNELGKIISHALTFTDCKAPVLDAEVVVQTVVQKILAVR